MSADNEQAAAPKVLWTNRIGEPLVQQSPEGILINTAAGDTGKGFARMSVGQRGIVEDLVTQVLALSQPAAP